MTNKTYTIKIIETDKGFAIDRTNDGFSALELMGVLQMTQLDIMAQLAGTIKPDYVKRNIVTDEDAK
jgi:hypothetical protein